MGVCWKSHNKEIAVREIVMMVFAALLLPEATRAQREPTVPEASVAQARSLTGERKVHYLLRQLDLTREQRQYALGLIASILDPSNQELPLEKIYDLMAEAEQAEKDGDTERQQRITQQIRDLGKGLHREDEFFMNMETVLTDEQNEKLREARQRLKRNPSGALRPIDILRAVRRLELTEEQQAAFDEIHKRFRDSMRRFRRRLDDEKRFNLMNELLEVVKAELTPPQWEQIRLCIMRLRPDLAGVAGLRARLQPATQPSDRDD